MEEQNSAQYYKGKHESVGEMYLKASGSKDTLTILDERFRKSKIFTPITQEEFDNQPNRTTLDAVITL